MCGSCHRPLYYLVDNGVEYIVEPEQGLSHADTEEIKKIEMICQSSHYNCL